MTQRPIDRLVGPFRVFGANKLSGAVLLIGATVLALLWANSAWAPAYRGWFGAPVGVRFGEVGLEKPLILWINDGLMGVFFFHVGLEIKRELISGELSSLRQATLPAAAAVGGMLIPALIYVALNAGTPAVSGWGIPMATDIAFALGILTLVGPRVPLSLKVFLTALAIADDIGAVLVIAIFYTDEVSLISLLLGGVLYAIAILFNRLRVRSAVAYFILGALVWLAFLKSGVHATVAALIMAFTIPARTHVDGGQFLGQLNDQVKRLHACGFTEKGAGLNTLKQQHVLDDLMVSVDDASAPLLRLEHALVPVVAFVVIPIFALANAGVDLAGGIGRAFQDNVALGILLGLSLGKPLGVTLFAWLAVRLKIADLPAGVGFRQVLGAGCLAGVGFTMALFIGGLAFPDPSMLDAAKVGILAASLVSGVVGFVLLRRELSNSGAS